MNILIEVVLHEQKKTTRFFKQNKSCEKLPIYVKHTQVQDVFRWGQQNTFNFILYESKMANFDLCAFGSVFFFEGWILFKAHLFSLSAIE